MAGGLPKPGQPGNPGSTFTGYGVGVPSYLNEAQRNVGKYWRMIEFGSQGFAGHWLGGLWSDAGSIETFSGRSGRGENQGLFIPFGLQGTGSGNLEVAQVAAIRALGYLAATGQLYGTVGKKTGKVNTFVAYRALLRRIEEGRTGPTLSYVKAEIPGMNAYKKAAAQFNPAEKERAAIAEVLGQLSQFTRTGRKVRVADMGVGRTSPPVLRGAEFRARHGFVSGNVLSNNARSLGNIVDQALRRELTAVNRILAEELAIATANEINESTVRAEVSKHALEEATLSPQNRFPA